ncbi:hypothetical protein [Thiosocius teredinicola]|uniref:hypothetical protein n=1 Tax=Thiosocius teredinicola TaxID=1973002 RepID=UPI000F7755F6
MHERHAFEFRRSPDSYLWIRRTNPAPSLAAAETIAGTIRSFYVAAQQHGMKLALSFVPMDPHGARAANSIDQDQAFISLKPKADTVVQRCQQHDRPLTDRITTS